MIVEYKAVVTKAEGSPAGYTDSTVNRTATYVDSNPEVVRHWVLGLLVNAPENTTVECFRVITDPVLLDDVIQAVDRGEF